MAAAPDGTTYAIVHTTEAGLVIAPGELDLTLGAEDGAVVAFDPDGHAAHATRYHSTAVTSARLTLLTQGGVMLTAEASSDAVVAMGTAKEKRVTTAGVFYARFDSKLELDSLADVGVTTLAYSSAGLPDGSMVFTESFSDQVTLGSGAKQITLTNADDTADGYIAKFDPQGEFVWAVHTSGLADVTPLTTGTSSDGSAWVIGAYSGATPGNYALAPTQGSELSTTTAGREHFLARISPDGTPAWIVRYASDNYLQGIAVATSALGAIVAGDFRGRATFGLPSGADVGPATLETTFALRVGP